MIPPPAGFRRTMALKLRPAKRPLAGHAFLKASGWPLASQQVVG